METFRLPFTDNSSRHDGNLDHADVYGSDFSLVSQNVNPDRFSHRTTKIRTPLQTLRAWSPEIVATIFGIIALLAIVVVLKVYEGRPLDSLGLPEYLTLNGLVAAIATLQRVFLVVPVGSVLSQEAWLWLDQNKHQANPRSRLKDLSLSDAASRGAWGSIIVLFYSGRRWLMWLGALIMILSLAIGTFTQQLIINKNIAVTSPTSALRPGNIAWSQYYNDSHGNPAEAAFGSTLKVKAAAYNGFLADDITNLEVLCPSGNCTFPSTPSIAVCGDCVATTNSLSNCNSTNCNYTTSLGSTFTLANWTYSGYADGAGFQSQSRRVNNTVNGNLTLVDFEMLGAPYGTLEGAVEGTMPTYDSHRCRLWLCVNVYNTSVSNGVQRQSVVDSYSDIPNNSSTGSSGGDLWNFTLPDEWKSDVYSIEALGYQALSQQLGNMVEGTVMLNLEGYEPSSDTVEAVWSGSNNTHDWIQRVALSLTNTVRQVNSASKLAYDGTGFQLGIGVRWPWLSLPVVLMVMSIFILVIVMIRTARSGVGVWKGSPLTMLLFDIDRNLRQRFDDVDWNGLSTGLDSHLANAKVTIRRTNGERFLLQGA